MASGRLSQRHLVALAREAEALHLRLSGATYQVIAEQLGISAPGAYKVVMRACERVHAKTRESAQVVLHLELMRLDRLLFAVWPLAIEGKSLKAVDRVLKIMERRSRYLGLDAPTKTVVGALEDSDVLSDLANSVLTDPENQRLLDSIVARAAKSGPKCHNCGGKDVCL